MNATRLGLAARMVQRRAMSSTTTPATKSTLPPLEKTMLKDAYEARQHAEADWDLSCVCTNMEPSWAQETVTSLSQNSKKSSPVRMSPPTAAVSSWKKINFFLVIPALLLVTLYSGPKELAHIKHLKEHAREFEALPYLRKRKNAYPWGDDNLFYFPNGNPKPASDEE
ncbi:hypothetical protein PhCBS80983_g02625 [Powellomyces hirtus]|uniref:Cytochrome c oxidase subunit VIa n=1 Tax=Powellomyces hirtus TaxID=109895 RepID=A0A507E826_9FUNG|nr:hypothetical protein PhCBS80983_g02625 [Powellomyces hirtus]